MDKTALYRKAKLSSIKLMLAILVYLIQEYIAEDE